MSAKPRPHCVIVKPPDAPEAQRCFTKKADAKKFAAGKVAVLGKNAVEVVTAPPSGGG